MWVEAVAAVLLVASGLASLAAGVGLIRLRGLFIRLHAPSLPGTFGTWAVALAAVVYLSAIEGVPVLHALAIPVALAVTLPFTTVLVARACLFRQRRDGANIPPPPASNG
jgi:multicomponent K+:H+ antiporter subunit G